MKKIKLFWILSASLLIINLIAYLAVKGEAIRYISDILPVLCSFFAIYGMLSAYNGFKVHDMVRTAWLLILIGVTIDFLAESTYSILELGLSMDMDEAFPTLADILWCLGYLPFFAGLVILFNEYRKSGFPLGNIKMQGIILSIFLIISVTVFFLILTPIIKDEETTILSKIFSLYYPIGDILTVSMAMILLFLINQFGKGRNTLPWKTLSLGFFFFTISDLLYAYFDWNNTYDSGNFIDLGWNFGYLLIGIAGLYQRYLIDLVKERIKL